MSHVLDRHRNRYRTGLDALSGDEGGSFEDDVQGDSSDAAVYSNIVAELAKSAGAVAQQEMKKDEDKKKAEKEKEKTKEADDAAKAASEARKAAVFARAAADNAVPKDPKKEQAAVAAEAKAKEMEARAAFYRPVPNVTPIPPGQPAKTGGGVPWYVWAAGGTVMFTGLGLLTWKLLSGPKK